ncbi:hypothetical protein M472_14445 [Sphingobacterium paucimobilis HER1398]|uniref:Uncharacterized protein n=1 Tax=Sphingobacterium paucimobilis HER1398 TaxID=1346330 RepID=U2HXH6_9SPHI|nr:hypothetical protein M472_14445 [Sphingobacterium paucimobilis HER1398]
MLQRINIDTVFFIVINDCSVGPNLDKMERIHERAIEKLQKEGC